MAWKLLIDLREYMCMTHLLNIPYMVENGHLKVKTGHLTLLVWLPHSPQSGLKSGWRSIKPMSVYLASYIFQIYLKIKWKNVWKQRERVSSLGTGKQFYILVKVGYYLLLSLASLAFYFIHCLLVSIVIYYIVYWVHQCSIIWPIGS